MKHLSCLLLALPLAALSPAHAQDASTASPEQAAQAADAAGAPAPAESSPAPAEPVVACPRLPATTGLTWEYRAAGDADLCRALRGDGSEAFGLYIARNSPFEPKRSNRAEEGTIDGRPMQWYRTELAGQPNREGRETLIELNDGRVAHIWMQATGESQLRETMDMAQALRFDGTRLSSN